MSLTMMFERVLSDHRTLPLWLPVWGLKGQLWKFQQLCGLKPWSMVIFPSDGPLNCSPKKPEGFKTSTVAHCFSFWQLTGCLIFVLYFKSHDSWRKTEVVDYFSATKCVFSSLSKFSTETLVTALNVSASLSFLRSSFVVRSSDGILSTFKWGVHNFSSSNSYFKNCHP